MRLLLYDCFACALLRFGDAEFSNSNGQCAPLVHVYETKCHFEYRSVSSPHKVFISKGKSIEGL